MSLIYDIISDQNNTSLIFIGQAGFILRNKSGKLLGFDLYLSDCVETLEDHIGFRRLLPKILKPKEIIFDLLISSHHHYDHFDYDSMYELLDNDKTKLLAAEDCEELVGRLNINENKVEYIKPFDSKEYDGFKIDFVNCDHGESAPKAVGFVITVDNKKIYYAGDTCLRLDRVDEIKRIGHIDIMIAPINGAYGNLNESECVKLFEVVNPKYVIPCHYGMFKSHGGDIEKFVKLMKQNGHFNNVIVLKQGEQYIIN